MWGGGDPNKWITETQNGVTYQRSHVRMAQITDGTTKTALIGEKYMSPIDYESGKSDLDDQNIFVGHDVDNLRYTGNTIPRAVFAKRFRQLRIPISVLVGLGPSASFGSAHAGAMNMAFCDGSVQSIEYNIDAGRLLPLRRNRRRRRELSRSRNETPLAAKSLAKY